MVMLLAALVFTSVNGTVSLEKRGCTSDNVTASAPIVMFPRSQHISVGVGFRNRSLLRSMYPATCCPQESVAKGQNALI